MKTSQLAAQLYTVRDYAKTPSDLARTLGRIRAMGYPAVQVSGICAIDPRELARMLAAEGLVCCVTHEPAQTILEAPRQVAEKLSLIGCDYTAYPHPAGVDLADKAAVQQLIRKLDAAGKVLADAGKTLTYHNHHGEFMRHDGKTILSMIYDGTNPRYLQAELDTYWVQSGGGDPVAWCEKLRNRLPLLHLKDFAISLECRQVFAEIGGGNLDFPRIIAAAEKSGCTWFIVEQDAHWIDDDPFASLKASFDYCAEKLCG
jgi:sugar phosphate isomerase/epimerase